MEDMPEKQAPKSTEKKKGGARSVSRLGAVQALYQLELTGGNPEAVINEFLDHYLGQDVEGVVYGRPDKSFFKDLMLGVSTNRIALDAEISRVLSNDWPLDRLAAVIRAILRAGAYELRHRPDVPTKAIINEYVDVAHAFYSDAEPGFVNGVLDRLGRELRG
ncbi:transcription antitermination factor NusB [Govanella unica]|uniref:Transcription antitermination protein NusB n=1 Tax=Govanella unica TaxID=2975056 RepID=A0A9X3TY34_9PROT|nr:transcription antitermination factor NusB [Govania unica]MDA5194090.1 transcription antitermination factor NusB [Govania unica]